MMQVQSASQKYIIVKHAQDEIWSYYWKIDPKTIYHGLNVSARWSYSGKECGLKESYDDLQEAQADCKKINEFNPSGGYAVCSLEMS